MKQLNSVIVLLMGTLLCSLALELTPGQALALAPGPGMNRTRRDVTCLGSLEYLYNGICCLNCPAGTYVKEHCSRASSRGHCVQCDFDTYTEHDNGLAKCFQCTKCRLDQDPGAPCTTTQNTRCQCKKGLYCLPDQVCEVCKTCSRCKEDEVEVGRCTSSSNTVCRKRGSASASLSAVVAITIPLIIVGLVIIVSVLYCKTCRGLRRAVVPWCSRGFLKMCIGGGRDSVEVTQNGLNNTLDSHTHATRLIQMPVNLVGDQTPAPLEAAEEEEEDRGLGQSLPNTVTSSQSSLSLCAQLRPCQPCPAQPCPGHCGLPASPTHPQLLIALENEKVRRLIPLNGEESLKRSFDLFQELDIHYHNRFFRYIGLSDNAIRNAEMSSLEDKVYELLKIWLEKEGLKADFNSLIETLLHLDQRLSAENIIARAISNGHFKYEDD
ncbi:hematopoietic death receptor isoform X1 [Electrophorus electricus]|uniref:hematopoietic death receptor isoform X1 n=1 Tax=Electrophorus electricus TaxID=8005 RepID=UPI0015D03421|nr:hematopoietic death receptor isoform X1 [Electrophorus electricus]